MRPIMWVSVLARAPKNARKRAVHPNHHSLLCTHRYSGLDRIGTLFALRADDQPFTAHRNVIWDS